MKRARIVSIVAMVLLLGACGTQTTQEESDTAGVSGPTTLITEDASGNGGSGTAADGNTATGSGDENNATASTTEGNSTTAGGSDDGNDTGGDDSNTATGGGDTNGTAGSGSDDGNSAGDGTDTNGSAGDGGNDGSTTGGGAVRLSALKLTIAETTLNKDTNTTVGLTGTYADGTRKDLSAQAKWIVTPKDALKITGHTLTALKDVNVTLQAQVGDKLSNPVRLEIYWEVNGHRLPPEPDPKINNATLLGVDVNHNGVRDDVERWIYKTYDHPIERGIFMQSARAYQKVIVDPKKAHETMKYIVNAAHCESYWSMNELRMQKRNLNYTIGEYRDIEKEIRPIQFNTLDRIVAYHRFNKKLSGRVYGDNLKPDEWGKLCEFDENGNLKAQP